MGNYTAINITLDLFSAVLTVIIGIYLINKKNDAKENRYFLWLCIWNFLFIIGDLSDWCCNGLDCSWYPIVLQIGTFLYYAVLAPFLCTMMKYISEYLSTFGYVPAIYMRITGWLAGLHLLGCVLTPFTGLYYVISEENIYYRGKGVLLASILPVMVYFFVTVLSIQFRKYLSLRVVVALLSYVWFPFLGQIIQNFFRGVSIINAAITLAILCIFFNIQLDRDIQHEKDKQELAEANIKIMLSQIQPHFLYNTLAAIRAFCETDATKARESIDDFSVLLRMNMNSLTNDLPIPFEQELLHIQSYLNLLQQMYGENVKVEYDIQTTQFKIPPLSLQPIVENAVHKGIRKREGGGTIQIHTKEMEQYFQIIIEDDGVGFHKEVLKEKGHIGIQNVEKRLMLMCGGTLNIDTKIGKGTVIKINIPKNRSL